MEYIVLGALILVVGGGVVWWIRRQSASDTNSTPDVGTEIGGYGDDRWQREIDMWRGTLRRLERQAERYEKPPQQLQQQIDTARQRIARAENALAQNSSSSFA